ncbi:unnamed protein product [Bubo scandiacus]
METWPWENGPGKGPGCAGLGGDVAGHGSPRGSFSLGGLGCGTDGAGERKPEATLRPDSVLLPLQQLVVENKEEKAIACRRTYKDDEEEPGSCRNVPLADVGFVEDGFRAPAV